jgi:hypothetical protein
MLWALLCFILQIHAILTSLNLYTIINIFYTKVLKHGGSWWNFTISKKSKIKSGFYATFPLRSFIHLNTYHAKTYKMSEDHTARVTPMNAVKLCIQQILPQCFQTVLVVSGMEDSDGTCLWLSAPRGNEYEWHFI